MMAGNRDRKTDNNSDIDRGWAWVIAVAGMVGTLLTLGVYRVQGMFIVELMNSYETSVAEVSYIVTFSGIGAMVTSLAFMFGLGDIFHERALVVAAGIFSTVGFAVTYFSKSVTDVYVFGFCTGVSTQAVYSCSLTMAGKYFKRRLAIASGLISSGVSFGYLGLPPLIQLLFDEFSYRGAGLIMAGLSLNIVVCGILMRPNDPKKETSSLFNATSMQSKVDSTEIRTISGITETSSKGSSYNPKGLYNEGYEHTDTLGIGLSVSGTKDSEINTKVARSIYGRSKARTPSWNIIKTFAIKPTRNKGKNQSVLRNITESFSFFKSPKFVLHTLFVYLSAIASQSLIQFYPAITSDLKMTSYQSAMLLSMVGASDLVGSLLFGYLGDFKCVRRYILLMIPQFILCGASFLCLQATKFWSQAIYALVIGANNCAMFTLRSVVLIELFGLTTLLRRMGVTGFVTGIGFICGGPLFGYIRDESGYYSFPMQIVGAVFFVGGCCLLAIGLLRCRQSGHRDSNVCMCG